MRSARMEKKDAEEKDSLGDIMQSQWRTEASRVRTADDRRPSPFVFLPRPALRWSVSVPSARRCNSFWDTQLQKEAEFARQTNKKRR